MMKVAFISSEVFPFAKTGGLADVCGLLPIALEKQGMEVVVCLPRYKSIKDSSIVKINDEFSRTKIGNNIDVIFIENQRYFDRDGFYGDGKSDYKDNLERFQYFCLQSLKSLKEFHPTTKIVHCHDWQAALVAVYLKERVKADKFYSSLKTILTIHNLAFQGLFKKEEFVKLGFKESLFSSEAFEFYGQGNLLKAGILYADQVTTVSPTYAKEILTKEFGCGLDGVLQARRDQVVGILNGIDCQLWDPSTDRSLTQNFSRDNFQSLKNKNKLALQKHFGFKQDEKVPLFGFVGRLSHQKGIDLILESIDDLAKMDLQIVIQGVGDEKYHHLLTELSIRYRANISVQLEFKESMARSIYGASDFFLMPSLFEPCGLSQMIALRYGCIPIVYHTGGLADTIHDFNLTQLSGNGLVFNQYDKNNFLKTINRALDIYDQENLQQSLMKNAFSCDFSWEKSAVKYRELYQCLLSG